jgi:hypothetical protein
MSRKPQLGVAAILVGASLAFPSTAVGKITTLHLVAVAVSTTFVDVPPLQSAPDQSPSAGDVIVLRYRDLAAGKTVGYTREVCTVTDFPQLICQAAIGLRGGHIIVVDHFSAASRAPQTFAITGGTGLYANARGQGAIRLISPTRELLTLRIVT